MAEPPQIRRDSGSEGTGGGEEPGTASQTRREEERIHHGGAEITEGFPAILRVLRASLVPSFPRCPGEPLIAEEVTASRGNGKGPGEGGPPPPREGRWGEQARAHRRPRVPPICQECPRPLGGAGGGRHRAGGGKHLTT